MPSHLADQGVVASKDPRAPTAPDMSGRIAQQLDSRFHALLARLGGGLSPISLALAYTDWVLHLATQPAEASRLAMLAQQQALDVWARTLNQAPPGQGDARFAHEAWRVWPWSLLANSHGAARNWWIEAAALHGMTAHHQEVTRFFARQWLDMLAPSNVAQTNPEVIERTVQRLGANLVDGASNAVDAWRARHGLPPLRPGEHAWRPGVDLAVTPGKVVHRNHLVELIQYLPTTTTVQAEPVFIVPSWIMKYYILDLQPHNSLVKWLVDQGHTVFILSWRNPDESDAHLSLDDYLALGVFDALAAIRRILRDRSDRPEQPDQPVHACGYCLGGTLLALAAAALARPGQVAGAAAMAPLASVTLLAAETDFSEPGEMGVLIDESQVALIEDMMAERGYLTGPQMAGSFAYLHSQELVWSRRLRELWLGEPTSPNDLMAWNADVTRMPAAMHSQYLRRCYLHNDIAEGRFPVEGRPVALMDIALPMFVVGTERDHVSPWPSVYKIHRLTHNELEFVLTSGGHNAGIVSEPGHLGRHYAQLLRADDAPWLDPQRWLAEATQHEGSWWPAWHEWLLSKGGGRVVPARTPTPDHVLGDAPGDYVLVRYLDPDN